MTNNDDHRQKDAQIETNSLYIEKNALFSKSILWELQKSAYEKFGMQAWTEKGVPFYLTSNPHTAKEYVNIALGYIQDSLNIKGKTSIEPSEPLYIFDLGAGSGRFAFLFLKELTEALQVLNLERLNFCYVITDFVEENLIFCAEHPQMQSFIQSGRLDFALYDHSQSDQTLQLKFCKKRLSPPLPNPAIIIANYFFDTIPQDLFKVVDGQLMAGEITISVPKEEMLNLAEELDPELIGHLSATYHYTTYRPEDYYRNPTIDSVLKEYCRLFENSSFLFPSGAFQAIDYFRALTGDRLLLLAGDQGVCTEEQIREWGEPLISRHGSFSIAVSYHAIKKYFDAAGGIGLLTSQPDPLFVVMAAVLGKQPKEIPHFLLAFKNNFEAFEPSDYWKIVGAIDKECVNPSIELILSLIKLGNWDPVNLNTFLDAIRSQIPHSPPLVIRRLAHTIDQVWNNFYPVTPQEAGFVMNMGVLFFEMKRFKEALIYFRHAEALSGSTPSLQQNIAICQRLLNV